MLYLAVSLAAVAQTPDCGPVTFTFTQTGNTASYSNGKNGVQCVNWTLVYYSTGFSALSLQFEDAEDSAGSPGSWSAYQGTVATGSNPSTATTAASATFTGPAPYPWLRINVTALTGSGSIKGQFYGYRAGNSAGGGGGGGGTTSDVNVKQWNGHTSAECGVNGCPAVGGPTASGSQPTGDPVYVAGRGTDGSLIAPIWASTPAAVSLSSSGLTQIVALSSGKQIRITHLSLAFASAVDFQLEYGTGSNCGSGTTALTGVYKGITAIALDFPADALVAPASQAVCANLGTSVTGGGLVKSATF